MLVFQLEVEEQRFAALRPARGASTRCECDVVLDEFGGHWSRRILFPPPAEQELQPVEPVCQAFEPSFVTSGPCHHASSTKAARPPRGRRGEFTPVRQS